jgi:UDP-N-acetylmuramoyl-L-alanyl-D-glutamate--2,6-diaminopimelate ligase
VRALLEAGGVQCGLLGTVASVIGGEGRQAARTTPEAIDLQEDLRAMLDGGDGACAMEVSSHALELGRTDATPFAAAIFTNLTQDHLDFHADMEEYFKAKRRLFLPASAGDSLAGAAEPPAVSVVNVADPYGRRLAADVAGALSFAVDAPADYSATNVRCGFDGCSFALSTPAGAREVTLAMPGRFNVANALGALAAAHALGVELDVLVAALECGVRVPGRFEPVEAGQRFAVLVDYAHTPDSLENVLRAARELLERGAPRFGEPVPRGGAHPEGRRQAGERGRVLCVFGAGGDRDRGKRPLMGAIAARLADVAIVTSDNPRSEDPERIIEEIMDGAVAGGGDVGAYASASVEARADTADLSALVDRAAAIEAAVAAARPGDVVVIAGKGHEQGQELAGGRKLPFDDVAVARAALEAMLSAGVR